MSRAADFEPANPDFEARVRASFTRQRVMATIGARLRAVSPGRVEIELPFRDDLTQQHGFLHAGIVATLADSACGYAAFSLMSPDASVLSVEFKLNLLAPARGEELVARAQVKRPGRTISVCTCDVVAVEGGREKLVATLLGSMMAIRERPELTE